MGFRIGRTLLVGICGFAVVASLAGAAPLTINYQGRISDLAGEFTGNGDFMFAFVSGGTIVWNNDGTAPDDPTLPVTLEVRNGIFNVILGDTSIPNMAAIPPNLFGPGALELRVWFDSDGAAGASPELLVPDQVMSSVPYALFSRRVENIDLTPERNYSIGHEVGTSLAVGEKNIFIGSQSGLSTTDGSSNIFVGDQSGMNNVFGARNIFIGSAAGRENIGDPTGSPPTIGHDNIYIGTSAGRDNSAGEYNTLIGTYSGYISDGDKNTFVGAFTGFEASGTANTFVGVDAGRDNSAGDSNVFLGAIAGRHNSGNRNTIVGYGAGYNSTGDDNVFLGYYAGLNETGSNRLYIDNSATANPLLYGYFVDNSEYLTINGLLNINDNNFRIIDNSGTAATPAYYAYQGITGSTLKEYAFAIHDALWVSSHVWIDGTLFSKKGTYELAEYAEKNSIIEVNVIDVEKLLELQPEYFMWNQPEAHGEGGNLPETRQIGLNPAHVQDFFPELVKTDSRGNLYINYSKLSIILLEALKEQNERLETIESRLQAIETAITRE